MQHNVLVLPCYPSQALQWRQLSGPGVSGNNFNASVAGTGTKPLPILTQMAMVVPIRPQPTSPSTAFQQQRYHQ